MSEGHTVTTHAESKHVEVKVGDTVVASSDRPVLLEETGLPTRYYLPREDARMDLLRRIDLSTHCPFKGDASYYSLDLDGKTYDGLVWTYEDPKPAAEGIKDLLCFYPDRTTLEVDGQPVG